MRRLSRAATRLVGQHGASSVADAWRSQAHGAVAAMPTDHFLAVLQLSSTPAPDAPRRNSDTEAGLWRLQQRQRPRAFQDHLVGLPPLCGVTPLAAWGLVRPLVISRLASISAPRTWRGLAPDQKASALIGVMRLQLWRTDRDDTTCSGNTAGAAREGAPALTLRLWRAFEGEVVAEAAAAPGGDSEQQVMRLCDAMVSVLTADRLRGPCCGPSLWRACPEIVGELVSACDAARKSHLPAQQLVLLISFACEVINAVSAAPELAPAAAGGALVRVDVEFVAAAALRLAQDCAAQLAVLVSRGGACVVSPDDFCELCRSLAALASAPPPHKKAVQPPAAPPHPPSALHSLLGLLAGRRSASSSSSSHTPCLGGLGGVRRLEVELLQRVLEPAWPHTAALATLSDTCAAFADAARHHPHASLTRELAFAITQALHGGSHSASSCSAAIPIALVHDVCAAARVADATTLCDAVLRHAAEHLVEHLAGCSGSLLAAVLAGFTGHGSAEHEFATRLAAVVADAIASGAMADALETAVAVADRLAHLGHLEMDTFRRLLLTVVGECESRTWRAAECNDVLVPLVVMASRVGVPPTAEGRHALRVAMGLICGRSLTSDHRRRLLASVKRGLRLPSHLASATSPKTQAEPPTDAQATCATIEWQGAAAMEREM